jgi:DNA-binding transcriptional MerR regulator
MLVGITRPYEYNTYKDYPEENLKRMDMILAMKRLGFTLAEIKEAMDVLFSDGDKETFKTEFLDRKIASLDAKIAELVELRDHLKHFFEAECDKQC